MQGKEKIDDLLERFISGEINTVEKERLFLLFNDPENKPLVDRWLKKNRKGQAGEGLDPEVDFDKLLSKIHQNMKVGTQRSISPAIRQSRITRILRVSLRYAAVCLVACGVEWYILTQAGNRENTNEIVYNQVDVPHGSRSFIVLSDSTKVWLNAGASLHYPAGFKGKEREIFLEGEAFFEVQKEEHRPFLVRTCGMSLKVHGTRFNVKAYRDDPKIETTLLEGSVEVVGLKTNAQGDQNLFMKPGQKLILYKEHGKTGAPACDSGSMPGDPRLMEPVQIASARLINLSATEPEIAWRTDKLVFDKQRFDEVKVRLERWYGVTIEVRDSSVLDYRFSGTFDKETFEQAMFALKEAAGLRYALHKKHVVIQKDS
ncbi:MAG: DUF4974 domain-containing protein [Mangrovibacterium sp.]|nr:DUF4974 domain-containing protein [Mangrovibacterium sp.]